MTKEKCSGFPERYQVGEGRLSDLPGKKLPRADQNYLFRYPNSFRHLQISDPLPSLFSRSILLRIDFTILADPNPGIRL
ncbi:MAG TPA: hypothetical protein VN278_04625 [Methanosarcina sp.]|nr:hypothetical protein [Methanosarcina sp.]